LEHPSIIFKIVCPDRPGLVSLLTSWISNYGGNIKHSDHHTDQDAGLFLSRIELNSKNASFKRDEIYENEISNGKIDLEMKCKINNKLYSIGNLKTMHWSFEEIIERVSYGTKIFPGDVIGSGTVGKGCLLEINGTEKRKNREYKETWLKENDIIEMSIEKIGTLTNKIVLHK